MELLLLAEFALWTTAHEQRIWVTVIVVTRFREELRSVVAPRSAEVLVGEGVSRRTLEGPRWTQTSYGFYRPATALVTTPAQRILDVAACLPADAVIAGWAAAYVQGADFLDGYGPGMSRLPVPVHLPPGLHRSSTAAVRYVQHSSTPRDLDPRVRGQLTLTGPARTATDVARWAPGLVDAVVACDALLRSRVISQAALAAAGVGLTRRRGARQARSAIALSRPGVRSPWETRLRMFCVLDLSLPTPLVNPPVFDSAGRFVGAPDLLDEEAGLALEYDGAQWRSATAPSGHRDEEQHREDNVREETFERAGLIVVRADKVDLTRRRSRLAERIGAARRDGLRRDRTRDRWTTTEPADWLGMPA